MMFATDAVKMFGRSCSSSATRIRIPKPLSRKPSLTLRISPPMARTSPESKKHGESEMHGLRHRQQAAAKPATRLDSLVYRGSFAAMGKYLCGHTPTPVGLDTLRMLRLFVSGSTSANH